jgi:hypothetical protein
MSTSSAALDEPQEAVSELIGCFALGHSFAILKTAKRGGRRFDVRLGTSGDASACPGRRTS